MRRYLLAWLMAAAAQAAVIRGVVVENQTSKPVARSTVTLEPIAGTSGDRRVIRANHVGSFEFDAVPGGTYVIRAARVGFMPAEYGQKRWNSSGTPVVVTADGSAFVNIRLLRYSAIRGTVVDENDVGMPDHEVVAYRNVKPLEIVSRTVTDDRGTYNLHGLAPGTYVVRTTGKRYEDEIYMPTFGRETGDWDQARTVEVNVEQDSIGPDIAPFPGGHLFTLTVGALEELPEGYIITVTLASDLGRRTAQGKFARFTELPPGNYEVFAEAVPASGGEPTHASYQAISLGRDLSVTLRVLPFGSIDLAGAPQNDSGKLWARPKDLAGVGSPFSLTVVRGRASIRPGHWELLWQPPSGYYVADFAGGPPRTDGSRPDSWNDLVVAGYAGRRFVAASGPGSIRVLVKSAGDPVPGVPVFLEGYNPTTHARVTDLQIGRTDARGRYVFAELAPGTYRILATFEYLAPDVQTMDLTGVQFVSVSAHGDQAQDLDLYVIR